MQQPPYGYPAANGGQWPAPQGQPAYPGTGMAQGAGRAPACPPYVPPSGPVQVNANTQQVIQTYAPRLVAVARPLEQATPGYQVMLSILAEMGAADTTAPASVADGAASAQPQPAALAGLTSGLTDLVCQHQAALGYIRRFLCGEATGGVLMGLALAVNRLGFEQSRLQPQVGRAIMSLAPEQRGPLSSLAQVLSSADTNVVQAATTLQATVGPQIWETARSHVFDATPGTGITP